MKNSSATLIINKVYITKKRFCYSNYEKDYFRKNDSATYITKKPLLQKNSSDAYNEKCNTISFFKNSIIVLHFFIFILFHNYASNTLFICRSKLSFSIGFRIYPDAPTAAHCFKEDWSFRPVINITGSCFPLFNIRM